MSELKGDWILTLDEATREHDSMFFVEAEGTASSVREGSQARSPGSVRSTATGAVTMPAAL